MSEKKRLGRFYPGCGVFDGTGIHEAVICLLALDKAGVAQFYAPNIGLDDQSHLGQPPVEARVM